jgi:hypothetical protein
MTDEERMMINEMYFQGFIQAIGGLDAMDANELYWSITMLRNGNELAQYVAPKRRAVEHSGDMDHSFAEFLTSLGKKQATAEGETKLVRFSKWQRRMCNSKVSKRRTREEVDRLLDAG